jgi:photosystem II stability/assembly factor-like uncharacterized protein
MPNFSRLRNARRMALGLTILLAGVATLLLVTSVRVTALPQPSLANSETVAIAEPQPEPDSLSITDLPTTPWMSGGPDGASIRRIAFSPVYSQDHQVFAGAWGSGVFWMNDDLGVWELRNKGLECPRVMALEVSPDYANDGTLFLSLHGGKVYSTTNGGETWLLADTGLPLRSVRALAISPNYANDQTVYAGINDNGVYHTQDRGKSWQPVNTGLPLTTVVALETDPNFATTGLVYALSERNHLYRSDDGVSWNACTELPDGYLPYSMAMTPDGQSLYVGSCNRLYVSADRCLSWQPVPLGTSPEVAIDEIVISPEFETDQTMWATSHYGSRLYRSVNAGAGWAEVPAGLESPYYPIGLAVSPSYGQDRTLFVGNLGGSSGAYRSQNSGDTWTARSTGMTWNVVELVASPDYRNDRTIFAGLNGGAIFRSQNGGASWQPANDGYLVGADAEALALSPQYATDGVLFAAGYGTGMCRSDDRGETWTQVGMEDVYAITEMAIAPAATLTDALILVGTEGESVYRSLDGGWTWTPIVSGLVVTWVNEIVFSPNYTDDQTVFVATDKAGLFRSEDGGQNWITLTNGLNGAAVWAIGISPDFGNDGTLLVSSCDGVFRSQDRGDSWQELTFPCPYDVSKIAFSPHYATDQTIWMATTQWSLESQGGVFVSQDGGDSWQQYNTGLPQLEHFALVAAESGESSYDLFVGTTLRSVWQQHITPISEEWAVFVYINTDNDQLDEQAPRLFNYLELAVANNPSLIVRVLWDRLGEGNTVLYDVLPDRNMLLPALYEEGVNKWSEGEWNLGDPLILWQFIHDARLAYPAQHYLLVLVDHGGGWSPELPDPQRRSLRYAYGASGFSWDVTNGFSYLSTQDMGLIFNQEALVINPIDIVFYDACLMGMVEEAYEIRRGARYFIASENETWSSFPYDKYLAGIETRTPRTQVAWMVDQYDKSLVGYPRTLSAMDLQRTDDLSAALDKLAIALFDATPAYSPLITSTYLAAQKFDYNADLLISDTEGYVDLGDFTTRLSETFPSGSEIVTAAKAVLGVLNDPVTPLIIHERHQSGPTGWPYYTYMDLADATGLSIYLPLGEPDGDLPFYRHDQLAFARDTVWDEFLYEFLDYVPGVIDPNYVGGRGNQVIPPKPLAHSFLPLIVKDHP